MILGVRWGSGYSNIIVIMTGKIRLVILLEIPFPS